ADSEGIKATVADVEGWASMTYDELMAAGNHESIIAMQTTAASAQASLDVAGKVYGESYSLFSLSAGALEDGKISAGEAVQLGASAVSMAGTLISGVTGGMALGPIGAIAGL